MMRLIIKLLLALIWVMGASFAYAALPRTEVNSLIKCVENNTMKNAVRELNLLLAESEVTENIGQRELHITNFTSSAPAIKFNRNADFVTVCVTLNSLASLAASGGH